HVIDISGDGDNNAGRGVTTARDEAVAKGITINGLAILSNDLRDHINPPGGLEQYYRRNVIGGLGAFVVVSIGFESFGDPLNKKRKGEIARTRSHVVKRVLLPPVRNGFLSWGGRRGPF